MYNKSPTSGRPPRGSAACPRKERLFGHAQVEALRLCDLDTAFSGVSKFGNRLPNSEEQVLVEFDTNELATLFPHMPLSAHTLTTLFICIEPFKATLLSCLALFDIAKLLAAIRYELIL